MSIGEEWQIEDDDGFIAHVGPVYHVPFSAGEGRFRFVAEPKHRNRAGFVQGGMLMTFADRAMGRTARQSDEKRAQATAQFSMQFYEPVRIGECVEIVCTIEKQTRHLVFMRGELLVSGRQVASATGVWKIIGS
ncbi:MULTISPECIES: PaaI family thioesterase [Agrobacterium]|uniref:Acyl-coenzyme A thioesterase PaaI-like protein n=1 Tax=Agrobacterium tumefaciens TaxID=358 RepID=A0AAW8M2A7_AGRTU|nr:MULTISPECIES: PaaI family thioesterase [Agrobacterium]MBP2511709.1 acyl-coenzyme A thioesterase PaaI-like protein [Agrobacterium tumefaciens]MBP2520871.1 acyl-coenzyme A thioesterase PaaI-like protein [Agrobacterium tumefaciens]MBP2537564.1 acyl-coenzyme A thioesterase PaaI-like protein [Agrobacterium tumefaciens]MBP2542765.1 acyl-coenzyme A thioesterase PaaI-like protein [Agrobacterium tumefaciens]MBP2568812.1 acyl-coenzyme A thioesterase PaaI-like protein [Agrobacterium tumefaciens]